MSQHVKTLFRDYAGEGQIREACARAGVAEKAIEDFVDEYRANLFTVAEVETHIAKARVDKPQRWTTGGLDENLLVEAFGPRPNMTRQVEVVRLYGEDRAREIAAEFGTALGNGKGGAIPDSIKTKITADPKKGADNPWSDHPNNLDARGNYSARAMTRQSELAAKLGKQKAAEIAFAANGAQLGDVRPRRRLRA
jgi:hypothetical protein